MDTKRRVIQYIDDRNDEIIQYLQKLIQIPTQAVPGENYDKIAEFLGEKLSDLGCNIEIYNATEEYLRKSGKNILGLEGPRSNLVASYRDKKKQNQTASKRPHRHCACFSRGLVC